MSRKMDRPDPVTEPACQVAPSAVEGPVDLVVVEDSEIFRRGLVRDLDREPSLRLLGVAGDAAQGLALILAHRPQVALVDLRLRADAGSEATDPETGLALLEAVREQTETRPLVLSSYVHPAWVRRAAAAGAYGYLDKDQPLEAICEAIHRVARSISVWTPVQRAWLQAGASVRLTEREVEVLALVARGLNDREIARRLGVRPGTVGKHLEGVRAKLQVRNRLEAVVRARELGILPPDDRAAPR